MTAALKPGDTVLHIHRYQQGEGGPVEGIVEAVDLVDPFGRDVMVDWGRYGVYGVRSDALTKVDDVLLPDEPAQNEDLDAFVEPKPVNWAQCPQHPWMYVPDDGECGDCTLDALIMREGLGQGDDVEADINTIGVGLSIDGADVTISVDVHGERDSVREILRGILDILV